jgi:hypothetical protein
MINSVGEGVTRSEDIRMAGNVRRISLPSTDTDERRSSPRLAVGVTKVSVRKLSEQPAEASLGDLSIYGCRIKSPLDHNAGERVWLRFVGMNPVNATIVWSDNGFAGCRFDVPIDKGLFRSLTLGTVLN